jgi:hypothetical protein
VPWLLRAAELRTLADFVLPPIFERPAYSAAVLAVHVAIAAGFAAWRWRAYFKS